MGSSAGGPTASGWRCSDGRRLAAVGTSFRNRHGTERISAWSGSATRCWPWRWPRGDRVCQHPVGRLRPLVALPLLRVRRLPHAGIRPELLDDARELFRPRRRVRPIASRMMTPPSSNVRPRITRRSKPSRRAADDRRHRRARRTHRQCLPPERLDGRPRGSRIATPAFRLERTWMMTRIARAVVLALLVSAAWALGLRHPPRPFRHPSPQTETYVPSFRRRLYDNRPCPCAGSTRRRSVDRRSGAGCLARRATRMSMSPGAVCSGRATVFSRPDCPSSSLSGSGAGR